MLKFLGLVTLVAVASAAEFSRRMTQDDQWPSGRIEGGQNTHIEAFPYVASVQWNGNYACGASIIAEHWVITACQCVPREDSEYTIMAGTTYWSKGGSIHTVESIVRHEKYEVTDGSTLLHDVALVHVKEPFIFDATCQPISMFFQNEVTPVKATGTLNGWGWALDYIPEMLQTVNLSIIAKDSCNKTYKDFGGISDDKICASHSQDSKGLCKFDRGSPLAVGGRLAGIASWHISCGLRGLPSVYTEVSAYRDWIKGISGV